MKKLFPISIFLFTVFFGAACQTNNAPVETNQATKVDKNTAEKSPPVNSAPPKTDSAQTSAPQKVAINSPDGLKIVGTFYASAVSNSPAILMLHQWGSDRKSFDGLAKQFQTGGIAALAIDGRGFGESVNKADGTIVSPSRTDAAVNGMKSDVAEAVKWLTQQSGVDKNRIGILGASYGSSLAVIDAADNPDIKAVALLSPGINYFGNLPTEPAIKTYGDRPILLVASENDAESAVAVRGLDALAVGDKHQIKIYPKAGHGTEILSADVGLDKLLEDFFRRSL